MSENIPKTMKALVKSKPEPGLWLEEIEEPRIGINDVLIQVLRTGICGTDVHIYHWDEWAQRTIPIGMAIGHEFVGRIVEIGSNVADFYKGEIVSGEGHVVCGRCRNCFAGRRHLCAHTSGVGVNRAGAFAEYIALPMTNLWRHHEGIDLDLAAIFDPFGNAVHTALSFPVLGEDVLITGRGADRLDGRGCGQTCRGALRRGDGPESGAAGASPKNGCGCGHEREGGVAGGRAEATRHEGRLRCGPGNVG
jgi:D-arabinose 1-dehydrogenase-like Zn-dependent alcohol dehydrogenase